MTNKEKLINLRKKFGYGTDDYFADGLLSNGVTISQFKLGDEVWIVDRAENDYSCYLFLAQAGNVVIVSAFINDYDIEETLEYLVEDTLSSMDTDLCVFPLDWCYGNEEEAKKALEEEDEEANNG